MTRVTTVLLCAVLLVAGCGARPTAPPGGAVRIMPLGDSITDGFTVPGGYRPELYRLLTGGGRAVDFVGSMTGGPRDLADRDHEGHPGRRIDEIDTQVTAWVTESRPRIVLLHLGTNDVVQDYDLAGAPARLSALVDRILIVAPDADVYVASITPLRDATLEARVVTYNAAIPGVVRGKGGQVHFVDMHAALTVADLADGVHPSRAGYATMAAAWAAAIAS